MQLVCSADEIRSVDLEHSVSYYIVYGLGGCVFFFQAEDGIRDLVRSRGLGDVYKRQPPLRSPWTYGMHH